MCFYIQNITFFLRMFFDNRNVFNIAILAFKNFKKMFLEDIDILTFRVNGLLFIQTFYENTELEIEIIFI